VSQDRTARVWDARTGQALTPPLPHLSAVSHLAVSPDGSRLFTAGWNSLARVWDLETGLPLTEWLSAGGLVTGLSVDSTGQRLATVTDHGVLRIQEIPSAPTPVPDGFLTFAETLAGARLGERGNVEFLPDPARAEAGGASTVTVTGAARQPPSPVGNEAFYARIEQWLLAPPGDATARPFQLGEGRPGRPGRSGPGTGSEASSPPASRAP